MTKYSGVQPGWKQRRDFPRRFRKVLILLCLLILAYLAGVRHLAGIYGHEIAEVKVNVDSLQSLIGAWEDSVKVYEGVIEKCQR